MNKAEKVIKELRERTTTFTVKLTGDKKNKAQGLYIMMLSQDFTSTAKCLFHGINKDTMGLLEKADIKFKIIRRM